MPPKLAKAAGEGEKGTGLRAKFKQLVTPKNKEKSETSICKRCDELERENKKFKDENERMGNDNHKLSTDCQEYESKLKKNKFKINEQQQEIRNLNMHNARHKKDAERWKKELQKAQNATIEKERELMKAHDTIKETQERQKVQLNAVRKKQARETKAKCSKVLELCEDDLKTSRKKTERIEKSLQVANNTIESQRKELEKYKEIEKELKQVISKLQNCVNEIEQQSKTTVRENGTSSQVGDVKKKKKNVHTQVKKNQRKRSERLIETLKSPRLTVTDKLKTSVHTTTDLNRARMDEIYAAVGKETKGNVSHLQTVNADTTSEEHKKVQQLRCEGVEPEEKQETTVKTQKWKEDRLSNAESSPHKSFITNDEPSSLTPPRPEAGQNALQRAKDTTILPQSANTLQKQADDKDNTKLLNKGEIQAHNSTQRCNKNESAQISVGEGLTKAGSTNAESSQHKSFITNDEPSSSLTPPRPEAGQNALQRAKDTTILAQSANTSQKQAYDKDNTKSLKKRGAQAHNSTQRCNKNESAQISLDEGLTKGILNEQADDKDNTKPLQKETGIEAPNSAQKRNHVETKDKNQSATISLGERPTRERANV
ncbi:DNA ligase 1-like [Ptychodera flava]|uniref:DNA ligase 1-like n=1 Tax=Ptychodera flava TaxID=63121 RepID=UPI00396A9A36